MDVSDALCYVPASHLSELELLTGLNLFLCLLDEWDAISSVLHAQRERCARKRLSVEELDEFFGFLWRLHSDATSTWLRLCFLAFALTLVLALAFVVILGLKELHGIDHAELREQAHELLLRDVSRHTPDVQVVGLFDLGHRCGDLVLGGGLAAALAPFVATLAVLLRDCNRHADWARQTFDLAVEVLHGPHSRLLGRADETCGV
mmetsp:Transcript_122301/g.345734  ORF Transcript_122301/g.345734 Transcript_122301/m.345734 type:complete len:205 (+) Transcript_122301:533-1147(+)